MLQTLVLAACIILSDGDEPPEGITVPMVLEAFPAGYDPGFGRPALFRLVEVPPAEQKEPPPEENEVPGERENPPPEEKDVPEEQEIPPPEEKVVPDEENEDPPVPKSVLFKGTIPLAKGISLLLEMPEGKSKDVYLLNLDLNANKDYKDDGPPLKGTVSRKGGRQSVYFASVDLIHRDDASSLGGTLRFDFSMNSPYPAVGAFYLRTWMRGGVKLKGRPHFVTIVDDNNDGQFTMEDRWALVPAGDRGKNQSMPRGLDKFLPLKSPQALSDGTAWRIHEMKQGGSQVVLAAAGRAAPPQDRSKERVPSPPPRPKGKTQIPWISDLAESRKRAEKEGKLILLLVTFPECEVCRNFLEITLSDGSVMELLAAFVPLHKEGIPKDESLAHLKVPGYPLVFFLDESLKIKKRLVGFMVPNDFIAEVKTLIQ